jgi:hypothetical protein
MHLKLPYLAIARRTKTRLLFRRSNAIPTQITTSLRRSSTQPQFGETFTTHAYSINEQIDLASEALGD